MGVSEVYGTHSGKNLALHFYHVLESLELCPKLFCITADNASNNGTLAEELQMKLSQYDAHEHMLGCVGHVMNLAAKAVAWFRRFRRQNKRLLNMIIIIVNTNY